MLDKREFKKVKVGTILDAELYKRLKQRAAKEGRSISDLFEDALRRYEKNEVPDRQVRMRALENLFSNKFNLSRDDWRAIMEEDYFDQ
jgi:plasmid stability protein